MASKLTEDQLGALATATLLAQRGLGFTIDASRTEERAICDGLVESGHLEAVEDVEGGFRLSAQLAQALVLSAEMRSTEAALN
jgi:hypothetical protein